MADPRIEAIERLWRAMNARDEERIDPELTDDVLLDWSRSNAPYAGVTRGRSEAYRFLTAFLEPFEEARFGHGDIELLADGRALLPTRFQATGRGSGVRPEARGAQLIEFDGGRIAGLTLFQSVGDARRHLRRERLAAARLYFVCEGRPGEGDPAPLLDRALRGGVDIIQLRETAPRCAEELVALSEPFRQAAGAHGALFFINDHPELVEPCGADGVHVGQDDAAVDEARARAGPGALVGLSTHSPAQFDAALTAVGGARPEQISAGPVWETPTKEGRPAAGLGLIEHAAAQATDSAWFAIGGIDGANVGQVVAAGARRAVVVRAIRDAADPEAAARELRAALEDG